MTRASARAAEQMRRDGICRILAWSKPRKIGCAMYRFPIERPFCGHVGCRKRAGYTTPIGNRCYTHAITLATTPTREGEG